MLRLRRWLLLGSALVLLGVAVADRALYRSIRQQAGHDETRRVDSIVVFGAAEYSGRPSPVFKARLDHAFALEERDFAPLVITTGGPGGDRSYTEAGVGRDYLIQQGMASARILTETRGETTYQSARAVAELLRRRGAKTCLVVSDGFHLHRIKLIFSTQGITAYGSPAPASPIEADPFERTFYSLREIVILDLWYLGFRV